jgi:hypothetical protein
MLHIIVLLFLPICMYVCYNAKDMLVETNVEPLAPGILYTTYVLSCSRKIPNFENRQFLAAVQWYVDMN